MFNDVNLIVVGDSVVYGHLGDDVDMESCHNRSWVRKLGKVGNFKSETNLGAPGGSNERSHRVLLDHIEKTYSPTEKYLVLFCISELSRFELPIDLNDAGLSGIFLGYSCFESEKIGISGIGPWTADCIYGESTSHKEKIKEFFNTYYQMFSHEEYLIKTLSHKLFTLKSFLDTLNIKYFFTSTIAKPRILTDLKFFNETLPTLDYEGYNINGFLDSRGFKRHPCMHHDEIAYNFLANHTYMKLTREKLWNTEI